MREEQLFPLRIRTGMVFQEGALFDSLTVRDNVAYQLIQERMPTKRSISEYTRHSLSSSSITRSIFFRPIFRAGCADAWPLHAH